MGRLFRAQLGIADLCPKRGFWCIRSLRDWKDRLLSVVVRRVIAGGGGRWDVIVEFPSSEQHLLDE